ncbi:tetratricopeptide repeat protein [Chryseolinea lacunae]|uniref:WG repeat-containing protein n=1 Tax=Chryseolinea lacunae TaxID=2801331 RepID=A0ABS1KPL2_9BACT|nr:WG repeat-containing protein [Chryseolinea lacunae]MBL0740226.1 WG repeat-containing protein [Chryseolinea lacunae]
MRLIYKFTTSITTLLLLSSGVIAQGVEHQAESNIRKQKWDKAYGQLRKALTKDTVNTGAAYMMARYFFEPANPGFQIDSAHAYAEKSRTGFRQSSAKQRERLKRIPVDSLLLHHLGARIDSAAFARARHQNTEQSYMAFLASFTTAAQRDEAAALRDEAAFQDAKMQDSYLAFAAYLERYPKAARASEAQTYYERLLFENKTRDKQLISYENFLKEYPSTSHRREAERQIFELKTASGTLESYEDFLTTYPASASAKVAGDILFHLLPEDQRQLRWKFPIGDSLMTIMNLEHGYLAPFLHDGRFGFMDKDGNQIIAPDNDALEPDYRCGNISEDVVALPHRLVAQNGAVVLPEEVLSVDDLGAGFLLVEKEHCTQVLHKSGFTVGDRCVDDARVLNGKMIAVKKEEHWSLFTLTGRPLLPAVWDDVTTLKDVVVLKKHGKITLATMSTIAQCAAQQQTLPENEIEEVKAWPRDLIATKDTRGRGVVDQSLNIYIPAGHHTIAPAYFGATVSDAAGTVAVNHAGERSVPFGRIVVKEAWTAVGHEKGWRLYDPATQAYQSRAYDSILFAGPFALGVKADSMRIHFTPTRTISLPQPVRVEFVTGQGVAVFLWVEQGDKKTLYNHEARRLFTLAADKIQYAGENCFVVQKRDKKGLVNAEGKPLLPMEYDAIGAVSGGVVSMLKGAKFGLFQCEKKKLIKPEYTKNLTPYNASTVVAYKDGLYGFVGWDGKPLSGIEFSDVKYWNDTAAFVKKDKQWKVYALNTKQVLLDKLDGYKLIRDTAGEKLAIVVSDHRYGVINSRMGTVIPMTFSDVINVGSAEYPLYFTEKHVAEADIFVVIYYSREGKMLRKEVYEQEDYDKIYCAQN